MEGIYGLPLLGVVPESVALSRSAKGKKGAREALPAGEAEAFHLIRAHLRYFNVDRELRTLLVASAAPGDGKTTVARHLAAAAARMGARVLLLEADLRRREGSWFDVLVRRVGRNRRDIAQRLHETLTGAGAPLLGVVANGFKAGRGGSYGYGYSYDYAPTGTGPSKANPDGPPPGGSSPNGTVSSDQPVPTAKP